MKKVMILITLVVVLALLLASACSDKSSSEACRYEVTMNLDDGNYDAVIASACADPMQLGAAWFGKAGFDMQDVINRMIDANDSASGTSDLDMFMTSLVSKVSETSFTYLDNAIYQYDLVTQTTPTGSSSNKDAQFYLSLAETMKSLSLIKVLIDVNGDGTLNSTCDINGNGTPDEVDAASCALKVSSNISTGSTYTCTGATATPLTPSPMSLVTLNTSGTPTYGQTYSGLAITMTGTATSACTDIYKKLLYRDTTNASLWWVATTLSGENCANSTNTSETWPCPLEGENLDFVSTIDQTLTSAIDTLSSSLTGTQATDVQQSINDIKGTNCCTENPNSNGVNELTLSDPAQCVCSSSELATYLETI